jgi:hypothetical protein
MEAMYRLWELQEKVRRKRGSERTAGGRSDNL